MFETIFKIWFFISPFILVHLWQKNKEYREKADIVVQQINDTWDKDYKNIIQNYGTVENFLDCHYRDFDSFRDNCISFYSSVSDINRRYIVKTDNLLELIENKKITKDEIYNMTKHIKREISDETFEMLQQLNVFLLSEAEAHTIDKDNIKKKLDEIDDKYN